MEHIVAAYERRPISVADANFQYILDEANVYQLGTGKWLKTDLFKSSRLTMDHDKTKDQVNNAKDGQRSACKSENILHCTNEDCCPGLVCRNYEAKLTTICGPGPAA